MLETTKDMVVSNPFDLAQNIEGGTRYLAMMLIMLKRFDGDEKRPWTPTTGGLAMLNAGSLPGGGTRTYLQRVARYRSHYAGDFSAKV